MKSKIAHITINGKPLCEDEWLMRKAGVTCGHRSITAAKAARASVWKIVAAHTTRVVTGRCPLSLSNTTEN